MFDISNFTIKSDDAKKKFEELLNSPLQSFSPVKVHPKERGIYVLYENQKAVYVGRTNNLRQRLARHVSPAHNTASYALKRTRKIHNLRTTYKKEGGRLHIEKDEIYRVTFLNQIEIIKKMSFRFVRVDDHITQYLLELYATLAFDLDTTGFDNS